MRTLLKSVLWLVGIIAVFLLILQAILSPKVVTKAVQELSSEYLDGTVCFNRIDVSLFRRFPAMSVRLHDMSLTYPSNRFAALEDEASEQRLMQEGRDSSGVADTLAMFDVLEANLSLPALFSGELRIPRVKLSKARIFAKAYNDSVANWDIIRFDRFSGEKKDSSASTLPNIGLERVLLKEHPHVVFCLPQDSLYAMVDFKSLRLKGEISLDSLHSSTARVNVDSLKFLGRAAQDTLFFAIDRLEAFAGNSALFVSSDARAITATKSFGRLEIPLSLESKFNFQLDTIKRIKVERFNLDVAQIPLVAEGELSFGGGRCGVDMSLDVAQSKLDYLVQHFAELFWADASKIKISSDLTAHVSCKGEFVPQEAKKPVLEIDLKKLLLDGSGVHLNAAVKTSDLFAKNPLFNVNSSFVFETDKFMHVIPDSLGISASGTVDAVLKGRIRKSQLSADNFAKADLQGSIDSDHLDLSLKNDSLLFHLDNLHSKLAATGNRFVDEDNKKSRMLVLSMSLDSIYATLGTKLQAHGSKMDLRAHNAPENIKHGKEGVFPFGGKVKAEHLFLMDTDSCLVELKGTSNTFLFAPQKSEPTLPYIDLSSVTEWLYVKYKANRMMAGQVTAGGKAYMKHEKRLKYLQHFVDSVSRARGVSEPRMISHTSGFREEIAHNRDSVFEKANLSFKLNETMVKYYDKWNFSMEVKIDTMGAGTPYFPLKTTASYLSGSFSNDRIDLHNVKVYSGRSDLQAKGSISGLRRFFKGFGTIGLNLELGTKEIYLKEILDAYKAGRSFDAKELKQIEDMSDDEYVEAVLADSIVTDKRDNAGFRLILPSNVEASVKLDAGRISYGDYLANSFDSELAIKQRCLQLTNTVMITPVGNLYLEGFYATRNRQDIKAGVALTLEDVTVEKVVSLVPQVDTLVPVLSSLSGLLDCDLAVTTNFDRDFKIDYPSMTGVIRLKGENLSIYDNQQIDKLSRLLKFKDRGGAFVDFLLVEGQLKEEELELYPFYFNVDRYCIAMSGIQNMNTKYKYHLSVLKSPLPVKFGLDLWGDFTNPSFKLGKAKFKDIDSVPDFSSVIDDSRKRLSSSIHSIYQIGADKAIRNNQSLEAIVDFKKKLNYVSAVDMKMTALSKKEQDDIDASVAEDSSSDTEPEGKF